MSEVRVKKASEMPSLEEINRLLDYNPETGVFTWKVRTSKSVKIGDIAGGIMPDGYMRISIKNKRYYAHRIAKLIFDRHIDEFMEIDHVNGVRHDNRIVNLRCVTKLINSQNLRVPMKTNKLGFLGVHKIRDKFKAAIGLNGKMIRLGSFSTPEEAHEAYLKAKRELHEGCTI